MKRDGAGGPPGTRRRYRELLILGGVALVTTLVFWLTDLDIRVSRLFFVPGNPCHPWIHGEFVFWQILYRSDRYLTITLAIISLSAIAVGIAGRHRRQLLLYGLFIFLSTSLGAGLLVNELFKEHWGRPRPDSIEEFGGSRDYVPPLAKGPPGGGNSFASGHASIGFSFLVFWFIWRGRRPGLATWALIGAITLGSLLGAARVIQGRHFLSDVLWGAYIPYFVCLVLYHYVFRFPQRVSHRRI
ncbi:MAG: phosphatase PAP2 family protein [Candidatus Eisenbacteria bacterium]